MNLKTISRVGSLAVIFFFLPSLFIKLWDFLAGAPWAAKRWLVYLGMGVGLILAARYRLKKHLRQKATGNPEANLLQIAKGRLAKGEISIAEYREIRQELNE